MLFRLLQHFMRTLSKGADFYALIAESKIKLEGEVFLGSLKNNYLLERSFRKTVGGAVSSQSKHLICPKKKSYTVLQISLSYLKVVFI